MYDNLNLPEIDNLLIPADLAEKIIDKNDDLSQQMVERMEKVAQALSRLNDVRKDVPIQRKEKLSSNIYYPTTCGVDGAYAIEKTFSSDIGCWVSVRVHGFIPPLEERKSNDDLDSWTEMCCLPHNNKNSVLIRAAMIMKEVEIAAESPHNVVFIDGSFKTPIIYLNEALSSLKDEMDYEFYTQFKNPEKIISFLQNYLKLLKCEKTDTAFVAVPKYSSSRILSLYITQQTQVKDFELIGDKATGTLLLMPNEYVDLTLLSTKLQEPPSEYEEWHLKTELFDDKSKEKIKNLEKEVRKYLQSVTKIIYKPSEYGPSMLLEIPFSVYTNNERLAQVLEGVTRQITPASEGEIYPLYLADITVKEAIKVIGYSKFFILEKLSTNSSIANYIAPDKLLLLYRNYRKEEY